MFLTHCAHGNTKHHGRTNRGTTFDSSKLRRFENRLPASLSDVKSTKYRFIGYKRQFLKFPIWHLNRRAIERGNQTLSFEFRTKISSALLLYMDDGGNNDYIILQLRDGAVRLWFKFGKPTAVRLQVGDNLNDNRWHRVRLIRREYSLTLSIDGAVSSKSVVGNNRAFFVPQSSTYFGGLPSNYATHRLSLTSASEKAKFVGDIRKVTMYGKIVSHTEKNEVPIVPDDDSCSKFR